MSKKILIAEDDMFIATAYKTKLESADYEVIHATNGEEAMKELAKDPPDLVLLDLLMPVKNGFDVLHEMKEDPALKDIPVIVLSNLGQNEDVARCMQLGAEDFIVKTRLKFSDLLGDIAKLV